MWYSAKNVTSIVLKVIKGLDFKGFFLGMAIALYSGMNANEKENFKASIQIIVIWFCFVLMSLVF